jgi:hypothetical protein
MARGLVEIKGVTTRVNTSPNRVCESCMHRVRVGDKYERVARLSEDIESHHPQCFEDEFGPRKSYGE